MSRSVYLEDADSNGIRAKLDNGVLNISVPRQEKAVRATKIEIE
jgi:HSP20 family protein